MLRVHFEQIGVGYYVDHWTSIRVGLQVLLTIEDPIVAILLMTIYLLSVSLCRRFMTDNGKGNELQKLQFQNKQLENQLSTYRQRLKDLTELVPKSELERVLLRHGLKDILELPVENGSINGSNTPDLGEFHFLFDSFIEYVFTSKPFILFVVLLSHRH